VSLSTSCREKHREERDRSLRQRKGREQRQEQEGQQRQRQEGQQAQRHKQVQEQSLLPTAFAMMLLQPRVHDQALIQCIHMACRHPHP